MDTETLTAVGTGLAIVIAGAYNGWQSLHARREAREARTHAQHAADNSHPVSNGFTGEVRQSLSDILTMATEARDAATRAEGKVDAHLEAHANGHVPAPLHAVRVMP